MTAVSLLATPAFAEEQQGSDAVKSANSGVNEIVVTAQRREQSVLDVPLAIQATTGEKLQDTGIKQLTDLQFTTPGYNVADNSGYTQIFMRGIGNGIYVGADPSVATFIDDVPMIYGSLVNDFINVSRVEVLKGAQGGLYGRNATGGVINIITNQPSTDRTSAHARVSFGEYNSFQADGYANVPLGDKAALSISGERRKHDGYDKNVANTTPYTAAMFPNGSFLGSGATTAAALNSAIKPKDLANGDLWSVGSKLLVKPSDNFQITLAGDYNKKNDSLGNQLVSITPAMTQQLLAFYLQEFLGATGVNLPAGTSQGYTKKFTVANGTPGFVYLEDYGFSGTMKLNLPGVDLTSISAYRHQHTILNTDGTGTSPPVFAYQVDNKKHYFYQELRGVSTNTGPFQFITGATYLRSDYNGANANGAFGFPFEGTNAGSLIKVENWSVYAQASYDLTQQLTLTVSGRYVHENNDTTFSDAEVEKYSEGKFLPSANLSYKLNGGGNVYVRWARGFKSGGVNPVALPKYFADPKEGSVFKGELVDTFEGGVKVPLMDNRLQLTAAAFYNDYRDLQFQGHVVVAKSLLIIESILNAQKARTYGVEGSLDWRPIPALTLGLNLGYLNAKFTKFEVNSVDYYYTNFDGHQMPNAPEFQMAFNAGLDQPISPDWRLVSNLLVSHTSRVLYAEGGGIQPDAVQNPFWLVNVRAGLRMANDRFGLAVFANNLFNQAYTTAGSVQPGVTTQLNWGNPRVIGIEATLNY
jgi:iron complex outermembrane receptor protein